MTKEANPPWAIHNELAIDDGTDLENIVSLNQFVNYIVGKLGTSRQNLRTEKDRVRKAIQAAVKKDALQCVGQHQFRFGACDEWARFHKEFYICIPPRINPLSCTAYITIPGLDASGFGFAEPMSIDGWRDALSSAYARIRELQTKNSILQAQVLALEPYKEAAEKQRSDGKKYGQKGGRGRKAP